MALGRGVVQEMRLDEDDFEIMFHGYKSAEVTDREEAVSEHSTQVQAHVPNNKRSVKTGSRVRELRDGDNVNHVAAFPSMHSSSVAQNVPKKKKNGVHLCSELENCHHQAAAAAPVPVRSAGLPPERAAWTETQDRDTRRTIHDAKKQYEKLSNLWNENGVEDEEEVKKMIRQLKAVIRMDPSDYQLFVYRADCYSRLNKFSRALNNIELAMTKIPERNRQTFARISMKKADLMQRGGHATDLIFNEIAKSIEFDEREAFRLLCHEQQMSIFVRYAACMSLTIAYDEDARHAAAETSTVKQALRFAVKHSTHYSRYVHSPYRTTNTRENMIECQTCDKDQENLFLDCIIGRVVREVTPTRRNPSQLHDWYQDLDTENQENWTSLYVGNVTENCKENLQNMLRRYGDTLCKILPGDGNAFYSLNRFDNWMAPIFAMAYLQNMHIPGISPSGWVLDVKPKLKDSVPVSQKVVPNYSASIHFQKVLACSPTGPDDIIISKGKPAMMRVGLKKVKQVHQMTGVMDKELDVGYDAMKNQEHIDKNEEKGLNVYRLVHHVLDSVMERNRLILVANRDCLVALSKMEWDERVKICSYYHNSNGYMIIFLKRGFPDEYVDGNRKKYIGTTLPEFRGNQYQSLSYVPNSNNNNNTASPNAIHDFLTLNEVLLKSGSGPDIKMLVCTEIDGELDGEFIEIKYKDRALDLDYDKKADWCLFSKFSGKNLKLRVGERRGNIIISHDFTVDQLLADPKVRIIYDKKVNLMFENVKRVIRNSADGLVYVVDLGSLNPEYYKVLGDVNKYSELYYGKPLVPYDLLQSLNGYKCRSSFSSDG